MKLYRLATGLSAPAEQCVCPPVEEAGTMRTVSDKERKKLSAEIAGLESLDLNQLRVRWKLLYEIEAPPHLSQDWLRRAIAYRI